MGIKEVKFQHFAKGNSSLGSLIEVLVKQVKFLIYKSIKTVILDYFQFDFLICQAVHLINKRPISFRDGLRSLKPDELPEIITPELLLKSHEIVPIGLVPGLQPTEENFDPEDNPSINEEFQKLKLVRERLIDIYHEEFLTTLLYQATDKTDRYKIVKHELIKPGDIVLLSDKFLKRYHYPMGRVLEVDTNSIGEVTAAKVLKGDTRETVYRHATSLIPLIAVENLVPIPSEQTQNESQSPIRTERPGRRAASQACKERLQTLGREDLI